MVRTKEKLKAPYPYFGGKSAVASLVWERLGAVDNYVEPFAGSCAVLLLRPDPPRIETINDLDCFVANFWRATAHDPEAVAAYADGPVNEADLHSRHKWLVLSDDAKAFRQRMRTDPNYYDPKVAGWWCWGLCCWIGSGWCSVTDAPGEQLPKLEGYASGTMPEACGKIVGQDNRKPRIDGGQGQYGHGVHAKGQLPLLSCSSDIHATAPTEQLPLIGDPPRGEHRGAGLSDKMPGAQKSVAGMDAGHRPQLADAFSRGRGVHGHDDAGTCAQRRAWLLDWFGRLRDRLRTVRVCCGHWLRVCDSESVTTRLGTTGVFFDPPYSAEAGRNMKLYARDCGKVAHEVRAYCLERGNSPGMRIALCGYAGEGHEELEQHGWEVVAWKAAGGYGNRSDKGKENSAKERIWFSPGCHKQPTLFTD